MNLSTSEIINSFLLGGLLGLVGQGVRMLVGLKKLSDENADPNLPSSEYDPSRLFTSIFIGFVAGVLATIPLLFDEKTGKEGIEWTEQTIMTLLVAGYAGVDFIEGVFKSYLAKKPVTDPAKPAAPNSSAQTEVPETAIGMETEQAIG